MLPRLKREGHKVLIFSQMTKLLDILEDFLTAKYVFKIALQHFIHFTSDAYLPSLSLERLVIVAYSSYAFIGAILSCASMDPQSAKIVNVSTYIPYIYILSSSNVYDVWQSQDTSTDSTTTVKTHSFSCCRLAQAAWGSISRLQIQSSCSTAIGIRIRTHR